MKKKLSLLLLICILSALNINATVYEGSCGDNVNYSLNSETGLLRIYGTGAMTSHPWHYDYYHHIKNVEISDGVTSISSSAFQACKALTSVTIGNSITSIRSDAFYGCSGLTSVTIGNSVTTIEDGAFQYCSGLTSVTIPNSVISIGNYAFEDCSGLTSVTIGNSVTSIGYCAFNRCSSLTSVTIPSSVTSIGYRAFARCPSLTSIVVAGGNTTYDSRNYCNAIIETATNTLIFGCKSTSIPNNVTSMEADAFHGHSGLTSITIPNSVTSIGENAFADCYGLTSIVVAGGNATYDSRENCNAIIETATNTLVAGCKNTTIPNSVTSIGRSAFYECYGLTSIEIPNSVTSIGNEAFIRCSGLTSVTIPNSVTSIGYNAFWNCSGLTSVTSQIKEPFAFGSSAFNSISSSCALTVPYGTRDAYIAAGWTTDVFKGGIVEMDPDAMNINMSANEIGTYCCDYDLDFSGVSGLKAYIMSGFSPSTSTLVLTPVTQVPAGTGLLLKGAEGNYEVPCTTTDMYYTNLLKGVTTATAIDPTDGEYTNFILSNGAHGIGFYTLSESGELAANKAYLQLPTASVASLSRAMRLVFADDITGIDEKKAETKKEDNIFYDLQGRRVDNPTQGLYIVNGKKVFINK